MPARKIVGRLVALGAGVLTYIALSRNGLGAWQLPFAVWVTGMVWLYFAWCEFHAKREQPDEALDNERTLLAFRRHHVLNSVAAMVAALGIAFLLLSVYMWAGNKGIHTSVRTPNRPTESRHWHKIHHVPMDTVHHINLDLWWVPLLLAALLIYTGLFIWQNWKYSTIAVTTERLIQQRPGVYYMPWLKSYFNQTPYEQIVDTDNKSTAFGNIGHWWGRILIKWRLQKGSVNSEDQLIILDFIPNYQHVAGVLRNAYKAFNNPAQVVVQADTVVTTDDSTTEIQAVQEAPQGTAT